MRLVYPPYDINLEIKENQVTVLTIENTTAYSAILNDLWRQSQGTEGEAILSEGERILDLSKAMICIFNPFDINCNDRKILNKLYQEIKEYTMNNLVEQNAKVNTVLLDYVDTIERGIPYALDYNFEADIVDILKAYDIHIQTTGETILENLVEYLRVIKSILKVPNVIIVGLKYYLNEFELKQLYEFLFYEKINLIIVEPLHTQRLNNEKCWILDKDLCLISPD